MELKFHLIPIRDWNFSLPQSSTISNKLKFHLIPIRDWNKSQTHNYTSPPAKVEISLNPY